MKLTLYKHNIKPFELAMGLRNEYVTIQSFPMHIRKMIWYAHTVEYKDGEFTKILKARDRSKEHCQMFEDNYRRAFALATAQVRGHNNFSDFLDKRYPNCAFSKIY